MLAVEKSIEAFSASGMRVHITELADTYVDGLPKEIDHKLTKRYEEIFKLFLKQRDKIDLVIFWETSDDHSWKTIFRHVDKLPSFIRQEI